MPRGTDTDQLESRVLGCIELDATRTPREVATELGVREHAVRRAVDRLIRAGTIAPSVTIDISRIGFTEFALYFSLAETSSRNEEDFIGAFSQSDRVSMLFEVGGDYSHVAVVMVQNPRELKGWLAQLVAKARIQFRAKEILPQVEAVDFGARVAHASGLPRRPVALPASEGPPVRLDDIDHRLLQALSSSPGRFSSEYARILGIANATCAFRIERLVDLKIIAAQRYIVFSNTLGLHSFKFLVTVSAPTDATVRALTVLCEKTPECNYLIHTVGRWDFELGMRFRAPEHAPQFVRQLKDFLKSGVTEVKVIPVFKLLKLNRYPFKVNPTDGKVMESGKQLWQRSAAGAKCRQS